MVQKSHQEAQMKKQTLRAEGGSAPIEAIAIARNYKRFHQEAQMKKDQKL